MIGGTSMQRHHLARLLIVVAGGAAVIAAHAGVLYVVWSHLGLSSLAIAAIVVLGLLKHLGLLSPFCLLSKWCSRPGD